MQFPTAEDEIDFSGLGSKNDNNNNNNTKYIKKFENVNVKDKPWQRQQKITINNNDNNNQEILVNV
jgi:hypothetical protein